MEIQHVKADVSSTLYTVRLLSSIILSQACLSLSFYGLPFSILCGSCCYSGFFPTLLSLNLVLLAPFPLRLQPDSSPSCSSLPLPLISEIWLVDLFGSVFAFGAILAITSSPRILVDLDLLFLQNAGHLLRLLPVAYSIFFSNVPSILWVPLQGSVPAIPVCRALPPFPARRTHQLKYHFDGSLTIARPRLQSPPILFFSSPQFFYGPKGLSPTSPTASFVLHFALTLI